MTREPIEVTRQDRIYCLKASSGYHSEICEECKFYPNCDHMTQDDMTELTIKDLEVLEQKSKTGQWIEKMDACECPYCHKAWDYCDNDTEDFDYCPKYGAKLSENPTGSESEG
jgi:hypothetical protein